MTGMIALALGLALLAAGAAAQEADTPAARGAAVVAARLAAQPVAGAAGDYDALLAAAGGARIIMLGEATHGSREFYRERARITRRLIEEQGFDAVVLEAAWEPVRRLDDYVLGRGGDADAAAALAGFTRFPRWMWRNAEVAAFVEGLRELNAGRAGRPPVRLYGMDLYSVPESARAVVDFLAAADPAAAGLAAAGLAARRYRCFDRYRREPQLYGQAAVADPRASCEAGTAAQLAELSARVAADAADGDEALFHAYRSARVVADGEAYYRAMYREGGSAWNVREERLAAALTEILDRLGAVNGRPARIVVWAHNIHQGDARATDQAAVGEISIGQRMRERYGGEAVLVGFSTHGGRVRAAGGWGEADRVWRLRPALPESWSGLLHRVERPAFLLVFRGSPALAEAFAADRLERAVGVSYAPQDERRSHYFRMRLARQFDALIHVDETSPLETPRPLPPSRRR